MIPAPAPQLPDPIARKMGVTGRLAVTLNAEHRRRIGWQDLSGYGCDRCWWPALAGLAVGLAVAMIAGGVA